MIYFNYHILSVIEPSTHPEHWSWNHLRRRDIKRREIYDGGVAVRGWVSMKIYVLKNSCKMFNVSMNVLCLQ